MGMHSVAKSRADDIRQHFRSGRENAEGAVSAKSTRGKGSAAGGPCTPPVQRPRIPRRDLDRHASDTEDYVSYRSTPTAEPSDQIKRNCPPRSQGGNTPSEHSSRENHQCKGVGHGNGPTDRGYPGPIAADDKYSSNCPTPYPSRIDPRDPAGGVARDIGQQCHGGRPHSSAAGSGKCSPGRPGLSVRLDPSAHEIQPRAESGSDNGRLEVEDEDGDGGGGGPTTAQQRAQELHQCHEKQNPIGGGGSERSWSSSRAAGEGGLRAAGACCGPCAGTRESTGSKGGSECGSERGPPNAVPYPAKWRCFGRRPPAIHEFRPLGAGRVQCVRPAGKRTDLAAALDHDRSLGLAQPIVDSRTVPLPYGTHLVREGDIDPFFRPARGDLIVINPAQNFYRAMKSGYVTVYRGNRDSYSFGVGDLIVRLGRFIPDDTYIPYGNLELYLHTDSHEHKFLGRQPPLIVDLNYHNLDYESPGKHLAVGTFLNERFFPRRGDIIISGGAWAENYLLTNRKLHSLVKYWRPNTQFLPNDMLVRPYVDIGRCSYKTANFYWGAAELYTYSGKGLAWAYWGRDHHICDTPYPRELEHGIKMGHHKDEVGHFACPQE